MTLFFYGEEEEAFWEWVYSTRGYWEAQTLKAYYSIANWQSSPQYKEWIARGKPGYTGATTTSPTTPAITKPAQPTTPAAAGYQWQYDENSNQWVQQAISFGVPNIVSIGGYDYAVRVGSDGGTDYEFIGQTQATADQGITPWQQAQLDQSQQQWGTLSAYQQAQLNQSQQQAAQANQPTPFEQAQAAEWTAEQYRTKYAGSRDWINRWAWEAGMQNAPPTQQPAESPTYMVTTPEGRYGSSIPWTPGGTGRELELAQAIKSLEKESAKAPEASTMTNEQLQAESQQASYVYNTLTNTIAETLGMKPVDVSLDLSGELYPDQYTSRGYELPKEGAYLSVQPMNADRQQAYYMAQAYSAELALRAFKDTTDMVPAEEQALPRTPPKSPITIAPRAPLPNAPSWLPEVAPGQVTGQMITPERLKPASGQTMSRLSPDVLQGIYGYADWSAGRATGAPTSGESWLYQGQQLLPRRQPTQVYRWTPSMAGY